MCTRRLWPLLFFPLAAIYSKIYHFSHCRARRPLNVYVLVIIFGLLGMYSLTPLCIPDNLDDSLMILAFCLAFAALFAVH